MSSFNLQLIPIRYILSSPFHRWTNWDPETSSVLSKVQQQGQDLGNARTILHCIVKKSVRMSDFLWMLFKGGQGLGDPLKMSIIFVQNQVQRYFHKDICTDCYKTEGRNRPDHINAIYKVWGKTMTPGYICANPTTVLHFKGIPSHVFSSNIKLASQWTRLGNLRWLAKPLLRLIWINNSLKDMQFGSCAYPEAELGKHLCPHPAMPCPVLTG